jgi:hypothetical protein
MRRARTLVLISLCTFTSIIAACGASPTSPLTRGASSLRPQADSSDSSFGGFVTPDGHR